MSDIGTNSNESSENCQHEIIDLTTDDVSISDSHDQKKTRNTRYDLRDRVQYPNGVESTNTSLFNTTEDALTGFSYDEDDMDTKPKARNGLSANELMRQERAQNVAPVAKMNDNGTNSNEFSENCQHEIIDLTSDDASIISDSNGQKRKRNARYDLRDRAQCPNESTNAEQEAHASLVHSTTSLFNDTESCDELDGESENDELDDTYTSLFNTTEDGESEFSDDEDMDTKPKARNGLSAYELLRQERIERNNTKLVRRLLYSSLHQS